MKKTLLIALLCIMPHAAFGGMGVEGMPIPPRNMGWAASYAQSGSPTDRLSGFSCPIPEKYRVPLALTSLAVVGSWGAYQASKARAQAQELAQAKEQERLKAEQKKQKAINAKLKQVNSEFNPLITNHDFRQTYGGLGFDGWFNAQQRYIVKLIESEEFRKAALNEHGELAATDRFKYFGYRSGPGSHDFYSFTVDTPKSAKLAWQARQAQPATSQPTTPASPPVLLEGQALVDATAQLNPPLVLKFKKVATTDSEEPDHTITSFDNLIFQVNNSQGNSYTISIYEEIIPEAPKPGWFAGWFTRSKATPAPAAATIPASNLQSGRVPEPSSSGGPVIPVGPAATSGASTPPATTTQPTTSFTIGNIARSAETPPSAKNWWWW